MFHVCVGRQWCTKLSPLFVYHYFKTPFFSHSFSITHSYNTIFCRKRNFFSNFLTTYSPKFHYSKANFPTLMVDKQRLKMRSKSDAYNLQILLSSHATMMFYFVFINCFWVRWMLPFPVLVIRRIFVTSPKSIYLYNNHNQVLYL